MLRLFDAVLGSFDRLFVSIGSAELKGGAEHLGEGLGGRSQKLERLVQLDFPRFVRCRDTIELVQKVVR